MEEKRAAEAREDATPFNIANLRRHLAQVALAHRVLPDDIANRQKFLETSVYDLAKARLQHEAEKLEEAVGNAPKLLSAQLQGWMFEWNEKLQRRLKAEIENLVEDEKEIRALSIRFFFFLSLDFKISRLELAKEKQDSVDRSRLAPFLSLLRPEKLSLITILELMRLQGTGGVSEGMKTARALLTVGKAVELEYKAQVLKKNNVAVATTPSRANDASYFTNRAYQDLVEWRRKASQYVVENQEWTSDWSHAIRARVGSFLVHCLMEVAMVQRTAKDKETGEEMLVYQRQISRILRSKQVSD
jgi:DNA-directed RNA polymerase, mitochondrial